MHKITDSKIDSKFWLWFGLTVNWFHTMIVNSSEFQMYVEYFKITKLCILQLTKACELWIKILFRKQWKHCLNFKRKEIPLFQIKFFTFHGYSVNEIRNEFGTFNRMRSAWMMNKNTGKKCASFKFLIALFPFCVSFRYFHFAFLFPLTEKSWKKAE